MVHVPSMAEVPGRSHALVVNDVQGMPASDFFRRDSAELDRLIDGDVGALAPVLEWLAAMHELDVDGYFEWSDELDQAKSIVCATYLTPALNGFPRHLRASVQAFIDYYSEDDSEAVFGAMDTLRMSERGPVVVDFEFGHYGHGGLDLACLLRELVVAILAMNQDPARLVTAVWAHYSSARTSISSEAMRDLNSHLAIQVMNVLTGSAAHLWTGRLDPRQRSRIAGWCIAKMSGANGTPAAALLATP